MTTCTKITQRERCVWMVDDRGGHFGDSWVLCKTSSVGRGRLRSRNCRQNKVDNADGILRTKLVFVIQDLLLNDTNKNLARPSFRRLFSIPQSSCTSLSHIAIKPKIEPYQQPVTVAMSPRNHHVRMASMPRRMISQCKVQPGFQKSRENPFIHNVECVSIRRLVYIREVTHSLQSNCTLSR